MGLNFMYLLFHGSERNGSCVWNIQGVNTTPHTSHYLTPYMSFPLVQEGGGKVV